MQFNNLDRERSFYERYKDNISTRLQSVVLSGQYLFGGQHAELEERFFKEAVCCGQTGHLIFKTALVKNCTDAITLMIRVLLHRYGQDTPVVLPNFGAYPTAVAVRAATKRILFVDVDDTLTMDVAKLPRPSFCQRKIIYLPVHLFGNNCDMAGIREKAGENFILEDCAQSTGSGSGMLGDAAVFSFYPTKPLGTMGDGGAVCAPPHIIEKIKELRYYGINKDGIIERAGINSRMGEMECAVVNAKLHDFRALNFKRQCVAERYKQILKGMRVHTNCIWHQFPVLFRERRKAIDLLKSAGIPFIIHYPQHVSDMPVFNYLKHTVGYRVNNQILSLPCHAFMTEGEIQRVEEVLHKIKELEA